MRQTKNVKILTLSCLLCLCFLMTPTIQAETLSTDSSNVGYITLTPLDTATLPTLSKTTSNMRLLKNLLNGDALWNIMARTLKRHNYSDECTQDIQQTLSKMLNNKVLRLSCSYPSIQPNGDTLLLSGTIILPYSRELKGIILACHYTIGSNHEAPSRCCPFESIFTTKGYAVVMADYVGFGVSADRTHPYLYWQSAAKATIDLLNYVPDILTYYGYVSPREIITYGYSEGGPVSLGVAQMVEQTLPDWTLNAVYAGAGPYDVAMTYDICVEQDSVGIPCAIPMLIMGTSAGYHLNLKKEDFFQEPLLTHYEEWVESKRYTVNEIGALLQSNRLSQVMTASGRDKTQPETARFYHAMQQSAILGYLPDCQVYLFHSTEDDMVPFANSRRLQHTIYGNNENYANNVNNQNYENNESNSKTTFDFAPYGTHMAACIRFLKTVYQSLE